MAIKSFKNDTTRDIFYGVNSKAARKIARNAWDVAKTKMMLLHLASKLADVTVTPGMRLEPLKHSRPGHHSIRVNNQYRIIFIWKDGDAYEVSVEDPTHHQP